MLIWSHTPLLQVRGPLKHLLTFLGLLMLLNGLAHLMDSQKKLPMLTSETSRDDNSSHLERWELLHDAKPVDSLGHDQDGQDSCGVCEFFGLMVRLQSEIGSLVLLLQKIPEGFNLVEEKGSGLAMHVQNDACFHAGQVTNEYLTVMTRRFEPPTSLEQILARACWIACNQRRLHYDLLTPVQWALESFSSKDSQEAPAQSKDKVGERNPSHFNWCSIPISSPSAWY